MCGNLCIREAYLRASQSVNERHYQFQIARRRLACETVVIYHREGCETFRLCEGERAGGACQTMSPDRSGFVPFKRRVGADAIPYQLHSRFEQLRCLRQMETHRQDVRM